MLSIYTSVTKNKYIKEQFIRWNASKFLLNVRDRLNKQYTQSVRITVAFHKKKSKWKNSQQLAEKNCIEKSIV